MNEEKPPKAKWWSRPRPDGTDPEGDFALARPRPPETDTDFRLAGPDPSAGENAGTETPTGGEGTRTEAPAGVEGAGTEAPAGVEGTCTEASADVKGAPTGAPPVGEGARTEAPAGVEGARVEAPTAAEARTDAPPVAEEARTGVPGGDGRPRPLHDPDPYGTPPYGEPGPWAPAPPVQHPTTPPPADGLPARGTPLPAEVPPAPGPPPAPGVPPAPDPWRRYDPWAVAAAGSPGYSGTPAAPRGRGRTRKTIAGFAVLLALVSGAVGGLVGAYLERNGGLGAVELPQAGKEPAGRDPDSVAGIAARALPGVVTLHVSGAGEAGTGTGFVLDTRGHILTNNHVVAPAGTGGEISVTFHSGDTAEATVVGRDSGYDLAVVKVSGVRGLTPVPLGNSDNVQVGDPVVAIGAPFDLADTVTSGIISAKERPITAGGEEADGSDVSYVDALQTDAPINPGNSGGPLLDSRGRVIGINSAIRSADSGADPEGGQAGSIGLGFAIPVNQGKRVAEELIDTGHATHPVIGVTLDMGYTGDGARVGARGGDGGPPVTEGGPGDRAGLRAGDVITAVDGRRVHNGEELIVRTRAHRPGDRLELTLERDGEVRKVSLVLGSADGD
ncbi:trypsin-like peptidase domain-containing protein [Streptomyces sp. NPDC005876]|uniref:trypsin-like peptidase domain-containing protein n=1 Tax=Streptomyces sp. NPDC005876 TaxID=3157076 RepID=UPI0033DF7FE8